MSGADQLAAIQAQLQYAATGGAARLAAGVVKQAKTDAEIGAAMRASGPGVRGLLARSGSQTAVTDAKVDIAATEHAMAEALAEGGAALAVGRRR